MIELKIRAIDINKGNETLYLYDYRIIDNDITLWTMNRREIHAPISDFKFINEKDEEINIKEVTNEK